ncbi:MAG: stage III sporulation protein AB [Oscillospiraceae bacterium]|nr:stage III sporulation protein AB [Oscillospiraceae bacterium]
MEASREFDGAAMLLPRRIRDRMLFLDGDLRSRAEEIRLRGGRGASVVTASGTVALDIAVTRADIEETLDNAVCSSMHSAADSIRRGFVTAPGGYRIGICGSVVIKAGEKSGIRNVSSLCIRIPRMCRCADERIIKAAGEASLLVASPPAGGKTTLIRDIVRRLSDGGSRVALVDERGELAAMNEGIPQLDVGKNTDVLENCPKNDAVELLLRSMNPQYIAMDELGGREDMEAVRRASGCGVRLIAGIHCPSREKLAAADMPPGIFERVVFIERKGGEREYRMEEL